MASAVWGIGAAALVLGLGAWGGQVAPGERGSFAMNYPAIGKEVGGPSPRQLTGSVVVSVDDQGFIKRVVQPQVIEVASHVVTNVGDEPLLIRFESDGFDGAEVEWHSRDKAWNQQTRAIERELAPGEAVDVGLVLTFPRPLPPDQILTTGAVAIVDATTGRRLSALPVTVARDAAAVSGGSCCE